MKTTTKYQQLRTLLDTLTLDVVVDWLYICFMCLPSGILGEEADLAGMLLFS